MQAAIDEIKVTLPAARVEALQLDLCNFASIKAAAEKFISAESELHILLNNAGVASAPYSLTVDGYDVQWSVRLSFFFFFLVFVISPVQVANVRTRFKANYMGHHLFTKLLLPTILRTATTSEDQVRIINLSSEIHSMAPKSGILFDNINQPASGYMYVTRSLHNSLAQLLMTIARATAMQNLRTSYTPRRSQSATAAGKQTSLSQRCTRESFRREFPPHPPAPH